MDWEAQLNVKQSLELIHPHPASPTESQTSTVITCWYKKACCLSFIVTIKKIWIKTEQITMQSNHADEMLLSFLQCRWFYLGTELVTKWRGKMVNEPVFSFIISKPRWAPPEHQQAGSLQKNKRDSFPFGGRFNFHYFSVKFLTYRPEL